MSEPTALEVDFPAALLSEIAEKESWRKEVHRPATSTHKWWAKRLGTVFRGILASAVTDNAASAMEIYDHGLPLGDFIVLDPFGGSGVTAVEALKLGARAVSFDINSVATLVQRQALQSWDMDALENAFDQVSLAVREEIERVHQTEDGRTVLYYFWVAVARCPSCSVHVRLFDSPVFAKHAYPKRYPRAQLVCSECLDVVEARHDFDLAHCANGHTITREGAVKSSQMTCMNQHTSKVTDALGGLKPDYEMYAKMVLGFHGEKTYEPIDDFDRALYQECVDLLDRSNDSRVFPRGKLESGHNTDQALRWNFRTWEDFFNARQLYSLSALGEAISSLDAGAEEREALCALFSGTLEFNNMFCSFKGEGTGAVRHMFAHHVLKPERLPLEAHPWGTAKSSGSFSTLMTSRLRRADTYKKRPSDLIHSHGAVVRVDGRSLPVETTLATTWEEFESDPSRRAYVRTINSAETDLPADSVDLVVTDPPYMDNVHYSELADFFHAWLATMHPFDGYSEGSTTRVEGEVQDVDPAAFGRAIQAVWTECARVLKPHGLVAFTFHQARVTGWISLVRSLRESGLRITAIQPVKGEMSTSVVKAGSREPSNLDSIVVCRPLAETHDDDRDLPAVAADAAKHLSRLQGQGVSVGAGDIRSVVRGSLFAVLAYRTDELEHWIDIVDAEADRIIADMASAPTE